MLTLTTPWHRTAAAETLLASLTPADLCIALARPIPGPDHFHFAPLSGKACEVFETLEVIRNRAVDQLAGFTFASTAAPYDPDARALWLDAALDVPSVEDALCERFGDPQALWGRGEREANAIWRHDPGYLLRVRECAA